MAHTYKVTELAVHLQGLLTATASLGFEDVFYGDQNLIPRSPAACIEPVVIHRELIGLPYNMENRMQVYVYVYFALQSDVQAVQLGVDELAEDTAEVINKDGLPPAGALASDPDTTGTSFGGRVIWGHVAKIEYGYAVKRNQLHRADRLTVDCLTKTPVKYG